MVLDILLVMSKFEGREMKKEIKTEKEFLEFVSQEKQKENKFFENKKKGNWIYRGYQYSFDGWSVPVNYYEEVDILADSIDIMSFPLTIKIIENPVMLFCYDENNIFTEDIIIMFDTMDKALIQSLEFLERGLTVSIMGQGKKIEIKKQ